MPDSKMLQKAGKIYFLLVCLLLCTACGREKATFEAAPVTVMEQEKTEPAGNQMEEQEVPEKETTLVNINTADAAKLMTLPGIGKVRAAAIIEYRTNYGNFEKIEDIMNVKGIKTGIFSKINSLICVK